MVLYQQQELDNPLLTRATAPAELLIADIDSIKTWRQQQFKQQGAVVVEDSLATNEPRFILVFPINNPHYPARQLLVVLNLKKLLSVSKISYLDYFDTYLKLDDYFLPINSQAFAPLSKHELAKNIFQLSTSLPVFGEQPMTFHAVLNEPGISGKMRRLTKPCYWWDYCLQRYSCNLISPSVKQEPKLHRRTV